MSSRALKEVRPFQIKQGPKEKDKPGSPAKLSFSKEAYKAKGAAKSPAKAKKQGKNEVKPGTYEADTE